MTDNRTTELLPCPFCGGEAMFQMFDTICNIECSECFNGTRYYALDDYEHVETAWNARAERTCEIESSFLNDFTSEHECWYEFEMKCGYRFTWDEMEPPKFCPNCGGAVKVVDA